MNLNGINSQQPISPYASKPVTGKTVRAEEPSQKTDVSKSKNETGVIYEPSNENTQIKKPVKYTPNVDLVNKLKADAEARTANLRSLVEKLMKGQGNAIGEADSIWSFLRTGDFTVDAATKAQAQADIAEDGYWGVKQTSDRILDFAKALTGGDPSKIEEMRDAFEEGFKQATKTWGDELPEISQKTYEATMKKFDEWAAESKVPEDSKEM